MLQSTTGAGSGSAAAAHQCHVLLRCQAVIFNLCDQQANNMAQITRKCNKRRLCCSSGRGVRLGKTGLALVVFGPWTNDYFSIQCLAIICL